MKMNIKTTVSIIAIALSSMTMAQAGEHRGDRNYEKPRHERSQYKNQRRGDWKHVNHRHNRFYEQRHFRKHKRFNRHAKRHFRAYKRARKHAWKNGYRAGIKRGHHNVRGYRYDAYVAPRYYVAPGYSSRVSISGHGIPVLAGTLIGSAIANNASHGDPLATVGGAVVGAIIGNKIAHH